jgi:MFS family permease
LRRVLRVPAYRRLLVAYTLNELVLAIASIVLAFVAYQRTGSALGAMAFFLSVQLIPAAVTPWAVGRLEHLDPRRVLPALYALEAVAFALLAGVARHFSLAELLVVATIDGALALVARSLARAALVSVTSPLGLLREGNSLANVLFSVCFTIGPALGGVAVATVGASAALLVDCLLFVLIALTLLTARTLPPAARAEGGGRGRVRTAIAYVRRHRLVRDLLVLQAVALFFFTMSVPVEVVLAQHSLRAGAGGYGALASAWGLGSVAGSILYSRWRDAPPRLSVSIGTGLLGSGLVGMGLSPSLAAALLAAAVAGAGNGIEVVAARTAVQESVREEWMAIVMGLSEAIAQAVPAAGILLGGLLAELAGARVALVASGGGALAVTGAMWLALPTGRQGIAAASAD